MNLFDSHCHLQDRAFDDLEAVLRRAREGGVETMLDCGYDLRSSEAAVALARGRTGVLAAAGIHPHDAKGAAVEVLDRIAELARDPAVAAVGEIGLDFYRDLSPRPEQRAVLDAQLAIAVDVAKPVSVHSRGAEDAIFEHLAAFAARTPLARRGAPAGIMHCFGGTLEQAMRYVELGFLVSIACSVTYPNNSEGRRLAAELPLASIVVETDSPYLPPQARRGRRNEPVYVAAAVAEIALLRGLTVPEVAGATTANARRALCAPVTTTAGGR